MLIIARLSWLSSHFHLPVSFPISASWRSPQPYQQPAPQPYKTPKEEECYYDLADYAVKAYKVLSSINYNKVIFREYPHLVKSKQSVNLRWIRPKSSLQPIRWLNLLKILQAEMDRPIHPQTEAITRRTVPQPVLLRSRPIIEVLSLADNLWSRPEDRLSMMKTLDFMII